MTCLFPLHSSVILLTAGMAVYMLVMPYAEAAEQTILQQVVPFERQGRVFGFAQSVELAASPLTAFLIGPITQLHLHPVHDDRGWCRADRRLVWDRSRPRNRAGLRADRNNRALCHCPGTLQPALSGAKRAIRQQAGTGDRQLDECGPAQADGSRR